MKRLVALFLCCISYMNAQTPVDSTRIVRVLSFNIYHGETVEAEKKFDLDLLASVINDEDPDFVALQEVDFKTKRALGYDLATELGQRTKMAPLFGKAMPYDGGEYGEGVLSKYSFLSTKNHALPAREGKEPRAALEVKVQLKSGNQIRFIGTHLDHTKDETDRINQAKQINSLFATNNIPTILAGDLNAKPDSETMGILFKEWQRSDANDNYTSPASDPKSKIDYVLFRPANKWRVLETKVICNKKATDHCVLLSVLELLD
ncbi:MAG: endonuclease/exonuclease/phosphatase family protein [Bacteroidota bacterium]